MFQNYYEYFIHFVVKIMCSLALGFILVRLKIKHEMHVRGQRIMNHGIMFIFVFF